MPNVRGLDPAPILLTALNQGVETPYGPHAFVTLTGTTISLTDAASRVLATVAMAPSKPRARANLSRITGDTVTAVNALLRPYGKVKTYWRTGEYRWHPLDGRASKAGSTPVVPSSTPKVVSVTPVPVPVEAETVTVEVTSSPSVPVAKPTVTVKGVIETVKRWQDTSTKQPVQKPLTKTYSRAGDVLVNTDELTTLNVMKAKRDAGLPAFGLITGPAGTAKTRLAEQWAFTHDLPVVVIDGMSIQTATDWYGMTLPSTDPGVPFKWEWSDAAKLILTGEPCLIIVDELNRPENERALNGIMPLTDWKATAKPMGAPHAISLRPGQCIIATLNEGVEYVGTVEVDAAVRDRFGEGVPMNYTAENIEARILTEQVRGLDKDVAKRLVRVAAGQRAKRDDDTLFPSHNVISTRVLVSAAQSIVVGARDPKGALWAALKSRFIPEDFAALGVLIEAQFGPDAAPDTDLADDDEVEAMLTDQ